METWINQIMMFVGIGSGILLGVFLQKKMTRDTVGDADNVAKRIIEEAERETEQLRKIQKMEADAQKGKQDHLENQ